MLIGVSRARARPASWPWSRLDRRAAGGPGGGELEGAGGAQDQVVGEVVADELQADGEAIGGNAVGQAGGRVAGQVEGLGEPAHAARVGVWRAADLLGD